MTHDRLRLFFALPCPEPVAETLTAWSRANCPDGRALHPADLHITLAFLGSQPAERLPTLTALAERLPLPDFELELALLERWSDLLVLMPPGPDRAAGIPGLPAGALAGGGGDLRTTRLSSASDPGAPTRRQLPAEPRPAGRLAGPRVGSVPECRAAAALPVSGPLADCVGP